MVDSVGRGESGDTVYIILAPLWSLIIISANFIAKSIAGAGTWGYIMLSLVAMLRLCAVSRLITRMIGPIALALALANFTTGK